MSVLSVFGNNLRLLSQYRSTLAKVAQDLDIHRVQFQRYLKGESFPKPNVLEQICHYFSVDARIMTEPLTPGLLADMRRATNSQRICYANKEEWAKVLSYVAPNQDFFSGTHFLEDGLYCLWRWAMSNSDKMVRVLLQFWTEDGIKFVRGYDTATIYQGMASTPSRREFRGVCLKMNWGYTILFFHAEPSRIVSMMYISPAQIENLRVAYTGFGTLSRDEAPNHRRMSRSVIEKVEGGRAQLIREAHKKDLYDPIDVPIAIRTRIDQPMG